MQYPNRLPCAENGAVLLAPAGTRDNDGVWRQGARTSHAVKFATTPAPGVLGGAMDVQEDHGGARLREQRIFYIPRADLDRLPRPIESDSDGQAIFDMINWQGNDYRVERVFDWGEFAEVRTLRGNA